MRYSALVFWFLISCALVMLVVLVAGLSKVLSLAVGFDDLSKIFLGILVNVVSVSVAGGVGYWIWLRQKKLETDRGRLDVANSVFMELLHIYEDLRALKKKYKGLDSDCPVMRAFDTHEYMVGVSSNDLDVSVLSFVTAKSFSKAGINSLSEVRDLVSAYNTLVDAWLIRDAVASELFSKLRDRKPKWREGTVAASELVEMVGFYKFDQFVGLTQICILRTDSAMTAVVELIEKLPKAIMREIPFNSVKSYGPMTTIDLYDTEVLRVTPELDYVELARILGVSSKEARARYS